MTTRQCLLVLIPLAYVVGSIPFGLLVGLAKGVDVRTAGSGNIGATNVGRVLGKRFFFLVFLLDLLKGLLMMLLASAFAAHAAENDEWLYVLWLLIGMAAIIGHMYSIFLGFKGGKGVSTSAGVVLGLWPYFTLPAVLGLMVFAAMVQVTKYISVSSMVAATSFAVIYLVMGLKLGWDPAGRQLPLLAFAFLMAGMIVYKHRGNIARLRAGTENRIGGKA